MLIDNRNFKASSQDIGTPSRARNRTIFAAWCRPCGLHPVSRVQGERGSHSALDRNHETWNRARRPLRFMDQQRRNNFSFFEGCSAKRQGGAMSSIPFENLGTLELAARLATRKRNLRRGGIP